MESEGSRWSVAHKLSSIQLPAKFRNSLRQQEGDVECGELESDAKPKWIPQSIDPKFYSDKFNGKNSKILVIDFMGYLIMFIKSFLFK